MHNKIIVIEGTDGCGKETQAKLLTKVLNDLGILSYKQSFPNYGTAGSKPVESILSGELGQGVNFFDAYQSSVLFAVDRLYTYKKQLLPLLNKGYNIVFDRYVESNILYQASKINEPNEFNSYVEWLLDFEYNKLKLPKPDITIYLNLPPNVSSQLINNRELKNGLGDDIYEKNKQYIDLVYNKGLIIAKERKYVIINCLDENNNLRSIESIHKEIMNEINSKLIAHSIEK